MNQTEKARVFGALHQKGNPVVLYNIWDAGTAKAVAEAGAKALATGSWSVAAAHGFADGEKLPMSVLVETAKSITDFVDLPLSVDFEGAYSAEPEGAAANVARLVEVGAVGINFEDRVVAGEGLYPVESQAARIRAIRAMADAKDVPFFITPAPTSSWRRAILPNMPVWWTRRSSGARPMPPPAATASSCPA